MALSKKFSELPSASSLTNNDLFAIAHEDSGAETGYESQKATATQIAKKILNGIEFPTDLPDFPANEQNPIDALEYLNAKINDLYPIVDVSGSIANFNTPLALPLVSLKANITAQQSGTGTPSPTNVRNISGFDSVNLTRCGKNLFDKNNSTVLNAYLARSGTSPDYNYYIASGTGVYTTYIKCKPNTTYTVSKIAGSRFIIGWTEDIPTAGITYYDYTAGSSLSSLTLTTGATAKYLLVYFYNETYPITGYTYTDVLNSLQIEVGTTATDYEAYNANTITINLGDTYYGGVVDVKNGTATITHKLSVLDENSGWTKASAGSVFFLDDFFEVAQGEGTTMCNLFVYAPSKANVSSVISQNPDNSFCGCTTAANNKRLFIKDTSITTLEDWITFVTSNNIQIVQALATPIELTGLTADNFTTLVGTNNIFADSGDVEVSFKQGIQEYIDAKIAETQALIL